MPASMALISQAYPDPARRARAVAIWSTGSAIASSSAPLLGGILALATWRLIFLINLPVGTAAIRLLRKASASAHHPARFDWAGQLTGTLVGFRNLVVVSDLERYVWGGARHAAC